MSHAAPHIGERAAALRQAFDRGFAEPARLETAAEADFLAILVGSASYALRLTEIAGLFASKKITRLPGRRGGLLGIAGFRGAILPVYGVQNLIGSGIETPPRWLAVAAAAPVALAFEGLEGQLRVPADAVVPRQKSAESEQFTRDFVRLEGRTLPILHLPSILDAIHSHSAEAISKGER